jgi:hypothetical protein
MNGAKGGLALAAGLLVGAVVFGACGGGGETRARPATDEPTGTATGPASTAEQVTPAAAGGGTPTAERAPGSPSESGEAPFFWRTEDGFESLRASEPYKVLVRVTNGYAEDTVLITAGCMTCAQDGVVVELEALRAEPAGEEEPGSFYPFNLELPQPGLWQVTVLAGGDEVSVLVEAGPPRSPTD